MKAKVRELHFTPSFNGRHNSVRSKSWLLLLDRELSGLPELTLAELASRIKCSSYKSLSVLISRWTRWHYIGYNSRHGGREYHLLLRGKRWLDRWASTMPLQRYLAELEGLNKDE